MPIVTFTGQGPRSRAEHSDEAVAHGWTVWGKPVAGVDVLVVGEDASPSRVKSAEQLGIAAMSFERWSEVIATGEV